MSNDKPQMTQQDYLMRLEREKQQVRNEFIQGSDLQSYRELLTAPMGDAKFVEPVFVPSKSRSHCKSCMKFIGPGSHRKCQECLHQKPGDTPTTEEKPNEQPVAITVNAESGTAEVRRPDGTTTTIPLIVQGERPAGG